MFGVGIQELILILVIVLVLFGGKNLPELSRGLGEAIKNIRSGFSDDDISPKSAPKKSAKK